MSKLMDRKKAGSKKSKYFHRNTGTTMAAKYHCPASQHIGFLENSNPDDVIRIVHISDTHMYHDKYLPIIPDGDILVHSGDFVNYSGYYNLYKQDLKEDMERINNFFEKLPHKYKIFVAGNHEETIYLFHKNPEEIKELLPSGIYLQDEAVTLEGVKFYGSPWNTSLNMPFHSSDLKPVWDKIPEDTDVLITHNPPFGIMDLGYNKFWATSSGKQWLCGLCTEEIGKDVYHGSDAHQGCPELRQAVLKRIRPKAHLFGHVHNQHGIHQEDDIVFCNASLPCRQKPLILDFHKAETSRSRNLLKQCAST